MKFSVCVYNDPVERFEHERIAELVDFSDLVNQKAHLFRTKEVSNSYLSNRLYHKTRNFSNERKKDAPDNLFGCRGRLCYWYSWLATMPHLKWTSMPSSPTMICSTSCFMIMLSSASMIAPLWMCSAKLSSHNFTSAYLFSVVCSSACCASSSCM